MKNKTIIILIILIIFILAVIFYNKKILKDTNIINENKTIEQLKYETGATANENIYEIKKDIDGRDILVIKQELLYKVALAGILEQQKPSFENIEETLGKQIIKEGIWISKESRENINSLIKKYLKDNYIIDEEGYLKLQNKTQDSNSYDENLQKCLKSGKTYILSMIGEVYIVDNMTGEIVLYPFEKVDAYQLCEPIEYENKKIIVLSKNLQKKLLEEELIEAMIEQMIMQ